MRYAGSGDSIADLAGRLVDDAKEYAQAEIAFRRAQVGDRLNRAKGGIILLVIAFVLVQAIVVTLLVSCVLMLERSVGIYGASAIVIVVALVITGLIARSGVARLSPGEPAQGGVA